MFGNNFVEIICKNICWRNILLKCFGANYFGDNFVDFFGENFVEIFWRKCKHFKFFFWKPFVEICLEKILLECFVEKMLEFSFFLGKFCWMKFG